MQTYVVQVRSNAGKKIQEKIDAMSAEQARKLLRKKYPQVLGVRKATFLDADLEIDFLTPVTVKERAVFSRQLATLVDAGVAIVRGLGVLADQSASPKMRKALRSINLDIQKGENLSESMAKHPQCFDKLYVAMVEAGEVGGVLDEVLDRLSKLLEDIARLRNQIRSAMTYPVAVALIAIGVFIGMTLFLVPIFADIFAGLGVQLPWLTQFMVYLSELMRSPWILIPISIIAGTTFALQQFYRTKPGKLAIDGLMLKLPILGELNEKSATARFCRIFGVLTRSGVPILNTLDIVGDTIGNQVLTEAFNNTKAEIQRGGMLSLALQQENVFPTLAIQMISIGEETGELDAMMMKVADFYEDEVEQAVKALTSLIEPLMICGVAVLIGTILVAMYLPLLTVFNQLG
ncbi:MAG: type II secretion system F family protein [Cyanobacteria bacterium P01_H01_bin.15]